MSETPRWQQDEKQEEKQEEKHDEKHEEKGGGEKWQRDPVGAVVWAAILIWAGVALLAETLGLLGTVGPLPGITAWSAIFTGAGLIVIAGAAFRLLVPEYRRPVAGRFILGAVLIGVGLGNVVGYTLVWPLVLVAIGVYLLIRNLMPRP